MSENPSQYYVNDSDFSSKSNNNYSASQNLNQLFAKLKDEQKEKREYVEKFFNIALNEKVPKFSRERFEYYANILIKWFIENAEKHYGTKDISDLISYVAEIEKVETPIEDGITSKTFDALKSFKQVIYDRVDEIITSQIDSFSQVNDSLIKIAIDKYRVAHQNDPKSSYQENKRKFQTIIDFKKIHESIDSKIYKQADKIKLNIPAPIKRLHLYLNKKDPKELTLSQKIAKAMPQSLKEINYKYTVVENIIANLTIHLGYHIKKFAKKLGKKLLNVVSYIIPIKSIIAVFKGVRTTLKFVSNQVNRIVVFANKIKRFALNIGLSAYNFLKKSYLAISKYTITTQIFKAFFRTYYGAFFLGYAIGFIYDKTKSIIEKAKNWYAYALDKTAAIREKIEKLVSTFIVDPIDTVFESFFQLIDQARYGEGSVEDILQNLRDGITGGRIDFFKPFERMEEIANWILDVFQDFNFKEINKYVTSYIASTGLNMILGSVGSTIGMIIGSAFGPIGTVAGGIIGAFVPDVMRYLFGKEEYKDIVDKNSNSFADTVNQLFYNGKTGTKTKDLRTMFQGEFGFDESTMFGSLFANINRYSNARERGELTQESYNFLSNLGFNASNEAEASKIAVFFEELSTTLTVDNVFKELNASFKLLEEIKDSLYYKRKEEEINNSLLRVGSSKLFLFRGDGKSLSEREKIAYRIFRAIVLGQTIPLIATNRITPLALQKLYKDLYNPTLFLPRDHNGVRRFIIDKENPILKNNLITVKQINMLNDILWTPFNLYLGDNFLEIADEINDGFAFSQFNRYFGGDKSNSLKFLGDSNEKLPWNTYALNNSESPIFTRQGFAVNPKKLFETIGLNYQTASEMARVAASSSETILFPKANRGNAEQIFENLKFQKNVLVSSTLSGKELEMALENLLNTTISFSHAPGKKSQEEIETIKDSIDILNKKLETADFSPGLAVIRDRFQKSSLPNVCIQDATPSEQ